MNNSKKYDLELWHKWVEPYYLYTMNFRWLNPSIDLPKPHFVSRVEPVLGDLNEYIVKDLLYYRNWRHQLMGCWFAGLKEWSQYADYIGKFLGRSYRQMGVCFALASFGDDLSISYLTQFIENYTRNKSIQDTIRDRHLELAIFALIYLDKNIGNNYYNSFYSYNQSSNNLEISKNPFKRMIDFSDQWLR